MGLKSETSFGPWILGINLTWIALILVDIIPVSKKHWISYIIVELIAVQFDWKKLAEKRLGPGDLSGWIATRFFLFPIWRISNMSFVIGSLRNGWRRFQVSGSPLISLYCRLSHLDPLQQSRVYFYLQTGTSKNSNKRLMRDILFSIHKRGREFLTFQFNYLVNNIVRSGKNTSTSFSSITLVLLHQESEETRADENRSPRSGAPRKQNRSGSLFSWGT